MPTVGGNVYFSAPTDLVSYYLATNSFWTGTRITGTSPNRQWEGRTLRALGAIAITDGT